MVDISQNLKLRSLKSGMEKHSIDNYIINNVNYFTMNINIQYK